LWNEFLLLNDPFRQGSIVAVRASIGTEVGHVGKLSINHRDSKNHINLVHSQPEKAKVGHRSHSESVFA
jgi:hypothetical protein